MEVRDFQLDGNYVIAGGGQRDGRKPRHRIGNRCHEAAVRKTGLLLMFQLQRQMPDYAARRQIGQGQADEVQKVLAREFFSDGGAEIGIANVEVGHRLTSFGATKLGARRVAQYL